MSPLGRIGQVVATTSLGAIGAIHLLWASGASWPASSRKRLARQVIGSDEMPSAGACLVVGGGMLTGSAIIAGAGGTHTLAKAARVAAALAFLLRGTMNGARVTALLGRPGPHRRFVELDRRIYRPLCLITGAAIVLAVRGDRRR